MSLTTLTVVSVLPEKKTPTAVAVADPSSGVIGSVVKVDGRQSSDPDRLQLTYKWTFDSVPIGSRVVGEGFRTIDQDGAMVSFSPDIVGEYVIGLVVSNGMFESEKTQTVASLRAILVPHGRGLVPDGKWIWSYIRDVWQQVDNKELFETLWSALIQIAGSELLKLYEVDFNKSIRDIQDLYQRRWLSYEPQRDILVNGPDFYFGNHYAGTNATTVNLGLQGTLIVLSSGEVVLVEGSILQNVGGETLTLSNSASPVNDASYHLLGVNSSKNGYKLITTEPIPNPTADRIETDVELIFDPQSTKWSVNGVHGKPYAELMSEYGSPMDALLPLWMGHGGGVLQAQVGDVIHFPTGPNKGFYRIVEKSGSFFTVDHSPPSFSSLATVLTYKANIYRPIGFSITQPETLLTDTVAIPYDPAKDLSVLAPGRLLIVGGQAYTIIRSTLDTHQKVPTVIITLDKDALQSGLQGLSWRTPPTLISTTQDFEAEGVSSGDLIVFDLVQNGTEATSIPCQVIGVESGRLGFVFTTEPLVAGQVPTVPSSTIEQIANDFHIDGVKVNGDGTISYSGTAAKYVDSINSKAFKSTYWNKLLTPTTDISVNPNFRVKPRIISRTRLIPVDDTLRSVPMLQNFIVQPDVTEVGGKFFQVRNGVGYELKSPPMFLNENIDYIIDGDYAFEGSLTFQTGLDIVDVADGDFVDRGIGPGDQFIITEPITLARTYYVHSVVGPNRLKLTRTIPLYALTEFVTAKVQIKRKRAGHFLRFTPGTFSASKPPPERFWAEVSFFDNNENVENNFGILVGLTREDIAAVSSNLNYRQAVSGIMFAYLRGSAIEKVRLGAQILLGLPFAENRGIIRSIENDYRLDINGVPMLGRLLIEDVNNVGQALGTLRIYTFPIESGSVLAGLEVNPATGIEYKTGDIVEKFAALSKGVEVSDYVSNPLDANFSIERLLQQFHSIRVRVNDNLFTLNEISLVSAFLRKITPAYVAFFISSLSEFFDPVEITDRALFKIGLGVGSMVDNASLCIPPTVMFDSKSVAGVSQIQWGDTPSWVRRTGKNLVTVDGSQTVHIANGGILNPRVDEDFEAPLTVPGDKLLIVDGVNAGLYNIASVGSDTALTVSDGPTLGFEAGAGIRYALMRPIKTLIRDHASSTLSFTSGSPFMTGPGALRTDGVSPGDWLLNVGTVLTQPTRFQILEVLETTPDSGVWDKLRVSPTPNATGSSAFDIIRSKIFESPYPEVFTITGDATGNKYTLPALSRLKSLAEVGDILQVYNSISGAYGQEYLVLDSEQRFVTPPLTPLTAYTVKLFKKDRPSTGIGFDTISLWDPIDVLDASLKETQSLAVCTSGSRDVTLQMQRTTAPTSGPTAVNPVTLGVRPTDYLKLVGMASNTNLGYGIGVFPIVEVTSTLVRVATALPTTETLPWSIIRRR